MAQPLHNPFYALLIAACAALLVTMLVCVAVWVNPTAEIPPWVAWIDERWLTLIVVEVSAIMVLGGMTIVMDRFFDRAANGESSPDDVDPETGSGASDDESAADRRSEDVA